MESSQKLTETKITAAKTREFLQTKYGVNIKDRKAFHAFMDDKLTNLEGFERDEFLKYMNPFLTKDIKNQLWEKNHVTIIWAISDFIQEHGRTPCKMEIANKTGLSRQTVHKHMKAHRDTPMHETYMDYIKLMSEKLIAQVFQHGMQGNVKASRLFFDIAGINTTTVNNYIQINNIKISQDKIESLSPDKLKEIELIIKDS